MISTKYDILTQITELVEKYHIDIQEISMKDFVDCSEHIEVRIAFRYRKMHYSWKYIIELDTFEYAKHTIFKGLETEIKNLIKESRK